MDAAARAAGLDRMRAYIAVVRPLLRLQQWDIDVEDAPTDDPNHLASINRDAASWQAHIRFGDDHFARSPEDQRLTVAHELTHIHLMKLHRAQTDGADMLDPTSKLWTNERCEHELEMAVDGLSRAFAPFLPLPPGAKEEGDATPGDGTSAETKE